MLYKRIKDLREDSDKNQSEIAKYLNTTPQYYGKYENGERELPFSRAIKIAEYYNVSLDYLAGRTDNQVFLKDEFNEDEMRILAQYRSLSERNKGKTDLFIEQLVRRQMKNE